MGWNSLVSCTLRSQLLIWTISCAEQLTLWKKRKRKISVIRTHIAEIWNILVKSNHSFVVAIYKYNRKFLALLPLLLVIHFISDNVKFCSSHLEQSCSGCGCHILWSVTESTQMHYIYITGSAEGFKLRINCKFCWLFCKWWFWGAVTLFPGQ